MKKTIALLWIVVVVFISNTSASETKPLVVILGGGVAGMSAAHELAERGYRVRVFEPKQIAGGKARSIDVPNTGTDGRRDLPGEHGFRFFPGFYRHITDSMKRTPYKQNPNGTFDNLVPVPQLYWARAGLPPVVSPAHLPRNLKEFTAALKALFLNRIEISNKEKLHFARKLYQFATTSHERRLKEYEHISWWDYIGAATRSKNYQKFFAIGLTRNLVAMRAEESSTRTVGTILLQLIQNTLGMGDEVDRVLNGPTNEVWIDPWLEHLKSLGVEFEFNTRVEKIEFDGYKITGVSVRRRGDDASAAALESISGDYYIAALPSDVFSTLITPKMEQRDPALSQIKNIPTNWMTGAQFFLKQDLPIAGAHLNYYDSPWALTSISQKQFWKSVNLERYGDGQTRGILSVAISNWDTPGIVYGKPAKYCTEEEIKTEVLEQLKRHLDKATATALEKSIGSWFLDPAIAFPEPDKGLPNTNSEPLLVHPQGSLALRPHARTRIPNLFLAADYVRTHTDLASMEAANEAARRAANEILSRSGWTGPMARVWPLQELSLFLPAKALDHIRFKLGLPHVLDDPNSWCNRLLLRPSPP